MSFPTVPDVDATVSLSAEDSVNLLLASVAFEELGLAHLINAEAEKLQYVLGTIEGQTPLETPPTLEDLLLVNRSIDQTLRDIIKKEMLLEFQLEDALTISTTTTSTTTTTTSTTQAPVVLGSAWSVGTSFGTGNAQYTFVEPEDESKVVDLGLGNTHVDIGTVSMVRSGNNLLVTVSTDEPYDMDQAQLYIGDQAPTASAPGRFPYSHVVTQPEDHFTSYTFMVDVSAYDQERVYVAVHARIYEAIDDPEPAPEAPAI